MTAAASRFEGGSWVRLGFLLTYAGFAYGCVVVGAALLRARRPRTGHRTTGAGRIVAALAAAAALGFLALPAIRFPDETLNGYRGLDLLSVLILVCLGLELVAAAATPRLDDLRVPAAWCFAGVLGGNLLIQRFTTRGTTVEYGLWWATAAGVVALAGALLAAAGVRGGREAHR